MTSYEQTEVELPPYEYPPPWIPPHQRINHADYNQDLEQFLPRKVILRTDRTSNTLGFNIRGGKEYASGIFISKVMPNTDAEKLGLKEGDQILTVNGCKFEDFEHAKAVKFLKSNTEIQMQVKYFPYGYNRSYDNKVVSVN